MGFLSLIKSLFSTEPVDYFKIIEKEVTPCEADASLSMVCNPTMVGMRHRNTLTGTYLCFLQEDNNNAHDPNAVALYTISRHSIIGYISRDQSAKWKAYLNGKRMLYICKYTEGKTYFDWGFPIKSDQFAKYVENPKYLKDCPEIII